MPINAKVIALRSIVLLAGAVSWQLAAASLNPDHHHKTQPNKTGQYHSEGYFTGGERSVTSAKLKDIRRAASPEGYERVVIDLETMADAQGNVPYFKVQLAPQERRFILSIWADVTYGFDSNRVSRAFARSKHIRKVNVVPRLEDGLTVIEFVLDPNAAKKERFEVFRLSQPGRIILDII